MAATILKRCLRTDERNRQCLNSAGHKDDCVFDGGEEALNAAEQTKALHVMVEGNLTKIGIRVLPLVQAKALSLWESAKCRVLIGYEGEIIRVLKSPNTPEGDGVEALTNAVRLNGGQVRWGVGSVTICGPQS